MAEKSKYDLNKALARLSKAGVRVSSGKLLEVKKGSIGLKMWALIDFVCNNHADYSYKIVESH